MKINSISNTNFKSNVKFIEDFNKTPEDRLGTYNSAAVHEALTQLAENGKNDTVKVVIIDGWEDNILAMKVEKEIDGKKYVGKAKTSLFYRNLKPDDVHKMYAKASEKAYSLETPKEEGVFDRFM